MYGSERELSITKIIITMLSIVIILMVGYSAYKAENSEIIQKENIKKVLKVENWENNTNTFELENIEQVEFVLDASGSNTDVDYQLTLELKNAENIKIYNDEYHLYESENIIRGTIKYKEIMKEKIILYIEKNNEVITDSLDNSDVKPLLIVTFEVQN